MKKLSVSLLSVFVALAFLTGCAWHVGGRSKNVTMTPTLGQQLIDLQKAKEAGAITDSEYQAEKTKLLGKQ